MKVRIIQADKTLRICACGCGVFRKTTRSKILRKEQIKGEKQGHLKIYGISRELLICNNCGDREERNPIRYHTIDRGG